MTKEVKKWFLIFQRGFLPYIVAIRHSEAILPSKKSRLYGLKIKEFPFQTNNSLHGQIKDKKEISLSRQKNETQDTFSILEN